MPTRLPPRRPEANWTLGRPACGLGRNRTNPDSCPDGRKARLGVPDNQATEQFPGKQRPATTGVAISFPSQSPPKFRSLCSGCPDSRLDQFIFPYGIFLPESRVQKNIFTERENLVYHQSKLD